MPPVASDALAGMLGKISRKRAVGSIGVGDLESKNSRKHVDEPLHIVDTIDTYYNSTWSAVYGSVISCVQTVLNPMFDDHAFTYFKPLAGRSTLNKRFAFLGASTWLRRGRSGIRGLGTVDTRLR
jgi:hypothetical protein